PSQAFALQYSFFLTFRTSRLDTCLRRAGLLESDAPTHNCKPINRSADSGGLGTPATQSMTPSSREKSRCSPGQIRMTSPAPRCFWERVLSLLVVGAKCWAEAPCCRYTRYHQGFAAFHKGRNGL